MSTRASDMIAPAAWHRVLRWGMDRRLHRFRAGHLSIEDGLGRREFGRPDDPLKARLIVYDPGFYRRVAVGGALGAAESFLEGEWESPDLVSLLRVFIRNQQAFTRFERTLAAGLRPLKYLVHRYRRNTRTGSRANIAAHYDLSNDFYALFLDPTMTYSCGIFLSDETSLEEASIEKLDRLCRKLELQPDDRVLEIGTGWGSFALHAARHYGCHVTTTTISSEQFDYARRRVNASGLEDRITPVMKDYRDLEGPFDKLVSIEMIEAVGHRYLPVFLRCCDELLKPGGRAALQAITIPDERYARYRRTVDFIQYYVFPGACLIAPGYFADVLRTQTRLRILATEDITLHYATTLRHWRRNFLAHLDAVRALGFSEAFLRLWEYYLCYCEAGFEERYIGDVQMILQKDLPDSGHAESRPGGGGV